MMRAGGGVVPGITWLQTRAGGPVTLAISCTGTGPWMTATPGGASRSGNVSYATRAGSPTPPTEPARIARIEARRSSGRPSQRGHATTRARPRRRDGGRARLRAGTIEHGGGGPGALPRAPGQAQLESRDSAHLSSPRDERVPVRRHRHSRPGRERRAGHDPGRPPRPRGVGAHREQPARLTRSLEERHDRRPSVRGDRKRRGVGAIPARADPHRRAPALLGIAPHRPQARAGEPPSGDGDRPPLVHGEPAGPAPSDA
jgi:hypothetical protein